VYKDRFYIPDKVQTLSVFCFQQDGKFLFELDRRGQGTGEYTAFSMIGIDHDNNHLLMHGIPPRKILVFDLDGNHIKSHFIDDIEAFEFAYTGNGYAAFYGGYIPNDKYGKNGMIPNILICNMEDCKIQHTDIFFPPEISPDKFLHQGGGFSSSHNGRVSLLEGYDDTVYHVSGDKVKRAYYVDFGNMKMTESFRSLLKNKTLSQPDIEDYKKKHDICNTIALEESNTHIYFIYFHKRAGHHVIYNKETGQTVDILINPDNNYSPVYNDINGGPLVFPWATDGESFYGVIYAHQILEEKESIQASNAAGKDKLLKMLDGINEDDNPVIVKMKVK
jgi:hypothetical protein